MNLAAIRPERRKPGNLPPAHRISEVVSDNKMIGSQLRPAISGGRRSHNIDAAPDMYA
ncbi:hypothetical protein NUKP38_51620 [Klebsiella variicola]|nr:hypothetical protein NUKP38_51620 [Klebsiella variicola]